MSGFRLVRLGVVCFPHFCPDPEIVLAALGLDPAALGHDDDEVATVAIGVLAEHPPLPGGIILKQGGLGLDLVDMELVVLGGDIRDEAVDRGRRGSKPATAARISRKPFPCKPVAIRFTTSSCRCWPTRYRCAIAASPYEKGFTPDGAPGAGLRPLASRPTAPGPPPFSGASGQRDRRTCAGGPHPLRAPSPPSSTDGGCRSPGAGSCGQAGGGNRR